MSARLWYHAGHSPSSTCLLCSRPETPAHEARGAQDTSRVDLIERVRRLVGQVLATQHELQTQRVVLQEGLTRLQMGENADLVVARLTAQCPTWATTHTEEEGA